MSRPDPVKGKTIWMTYATELQAQLEAEEKATLQLALDGGRMYTRIEELEVEVKDHAKWAERMMNDPSSEAYRKLEAQLAEAHEGWDRDDEAHQAQLAAVREWEKFYRNCMINDNAHKEFKAAIGEVES